MGDLYNSLLGGKQAARLDDFVSLLYDNVLGMQRMFTDSITSLSVDSVPTKKAKVVTESWNKTRSRKPKLSYQKGSGRNETITIGDAEIKKKE